MSVLLITGGYGDGRTELTSVEVVSLSGARLPCTVPPLPAPRYYHTQDGLMACGGGGDDESCITFSAGEWLVTAELGVAVSCDWWRAAHL